MGFKICIRTWLPGSTCLSNTLTKENYDEKHRHGHLASTYWGKRLCCYRIGGNKHLFHHSTNSTGRAILIFGGSNSHRICSFEVDYSIQIQLIGYRVYRSDSDELAAAIQLSTQIIPATNTSTTQVYNFEDREVELGHTYHYWLESVEYHYSDFHGPISINLSGTETPPLPLQTLLQAVYPNPFRHGTSARMEVLVKESETATVSIYNLSGQKVKAYSLGGGSHLLSWDGKDSRGHLVGSGIYFVKLSSGSINQTAKLMLIK